MAVDSNPKAEVAGGAQPVEKAQMASIKVNKTMDACFTAGLYAELLFVLWYFYEFNVADMGSTSDLSLFIICLVAVTVAIIAMRTFSDWMGPLVSRTLLKNAPFNDPLKQRKSKEKFTSQFWQAAIHFVLGAFEIHELSKNNFDWLFKPKTSFVDVQGHGYEPSVRLLYMVQLAIWIVTCFSHKYVEEKHKDYFLMYTHHLVTIALVIGSWSCGHTRVGIVVLFIHDVSDVPIDCLKLSNYLKLEDMAGFYFVEMSYTSVMVVWLYMRLYLYPFYVIYKGIWANTNCIEGYNNDGEETLCDFYLREHCDASASYRTMDPSTWPFLNGKCEDFAVVHALFLAPLLSVLLSALFVMHIVWYKLLAGIGLKLILGESGHQAGREDYEGHSDDDNENDKKED